MLHFRVTKYDPALRDAGGAYLLDEWTSRSDIGRTFAAGPLTNVEYDRVEQSYIEVAVSLMREAGVQALQVGIVEAIQFEGPLPHGTISIAEVPDVLRAMLRDQYWCKLEGQDAYIHVGWDYYMYVGVPRPCPRAIDHAKDLGIFVEVFQSPYLADD